jgi:hypothetical protein
MNIDNLRKQRHVEAPTNEISVENISNEEITSALKKIIKGKALGPDNILIKVWVALGDKGIQYLTLLFKEY